MSLLGFGFTVVNRISSTNTCPHHLSTTPRRRSTSIMKSALRLLHPTRRATLFQIHSRTRPRRTCELSLSATRETLHTLITWILGTRLARVSALLPHSAELWFLARRPGRRVQVAPACASARLRIQTCLSKGSRAGLRGWDFGSRWIVGYAEKGSRLGVWMD